MPNETSGFAKLKLVTVTIISLIVGLSLVITLLVLLRLGKLEFNTYLLRKNPLINSYFLPPGELVVISNHPNYSLMINNAPLLLGYADKVGLFRKSGISFPFQKGVRIDKLVVFVTSEDGPSSGQNSSQVLSPLSISSIRVDNENNSHSLLFTFSINEKFITQQNVSNRELSTNLNSMVLFNIETTLLDKKIDMQKWQDILSNYQAMMEHVFEQNKIPILVQNR
ncbi:hypothetical protein A2630_00305 [Candidatus Woesebacteria bacterium RIFCSPHIGHO2_01_FULL_44_10]|uniref:Uncharacterized protein n=1 Tax=Candidatus Woesebacteria bacterium RIFCSPLOWO2_01_FULL_44_14 TaxID=1802525 RepID=A0A1F8BZG0_9BACT|nr:MAG: hypothetical protein A2630_00305 [Candidatus Woesebacteria bacterium RIFCSPHIGHO2_01_FULL_44_10]OGM55793.1 MAG: hypothetical protein A3F62_04180 [Candidatus Woesebacteria bacterium RIFCSPHIGHO2_12_FULL_44_11]OGM68745.1 MAG: hypothetical protein A2975_05605 [Candidatus Woesebacteria bacterium RIFCSPLOWO2_01_FULL_44_14]